ncbi:hypothetical protein [Iningainema tapete]|uniref:Uncharacterized protein n=1 Tax=Iningainema tapete BLCC-T55 TaxID=2748662 RepID=A0A8J6XKM6_9CYAN|nr:hypothetical protein [Iningainema tapete]MBD2774717.1 hypothetical protein [Iningainema tapete BLCC-T55]
MLTLKRKNLTYLMLALLGLGYFSAISSLEVNDFFKSEIALIPIQLVTIIYLNYQRSHRHYPSIEADN